jgi:hypothetical protein
MNKTIGTEKGPVMNDKEASVNVGKNLNGLIKIEMGVPSIAACECVKQRG